MIDVLICMLFTAVVAILSFAFGFAVAVAALNRHLERIENEKEEKGT